MNRPRSIQSAPPFSRLMQSDMARWIVAALVIPVLVLGVFHRTTFLSHGHDNHGIHLHSLDTLESGMLVAAVHAADRGHNLAASSGDVPEVGDDRELEPAEMPEGVIITVPAPKPLPHRGIDLAKVLTPIALLVIAVFALPATPDLGLHVGSPDGCANGQMDLLGLSANDRLVRTSRALLI